MRLHLALLACLAVLGTAVPARAREGRLERGKVHAFTTARYDRAWCLYVPSKLPRHGSCPLVISCHGRGGSGQGEMKAWRSLGERYEFLVACPDMVTATNDRPPKSHLPPAQEDDEVLMEIVRTVSARFRVSRRAVMLTGFSGGGNPSYYSGLRHPEVFTHICTRGGNFAPQEMPDTDTVARGKGVQEIYVFFGDHDHPLIRGEPDGTGQAYQARDALKRAGYEHVTFEKVAGMKHESRPAKAAAWFADWIEAHKRLLQHADKRDALLAKAREALGRGREHDAVREALAARDAESRHGLRAASKALLDELEALGTKRLAEAQARFDAGAASEAVTKARAVARDFHGLPCAQLAAQRAKTWKKGS
jgi:poly(3-hydroxybutyrate) depolymerase